jgi:hypothetical protein
MKPIGQLNTSHAMYQPDKRANATAEVRWQTERANKQPVRKPSATEPDPNGSQLQRELWMRQRQQSAKIGGQIERQMLAEAESHLAKKRAACQCNIEQIKARLRSDPGLRDMLRRGLEEC